MKKIIALLMVLALVFAVVACNTNPVTNNNPSNGAVDPESIPDTMTSADGLLHQLW